MPEAGNQDLYYLTDTNGISLLQLPEGVTSNEALKLSAVYGAVQYICDFLAPLPTYIFERKTRKRIDDHRLYQVLRVRPNEAQTPSEFNRFLVKSLVLRGNGYAYNYRDPKTGWVVERIPLHPDCVTVRRESGILRYYYTDMSTGVLYCLDPDEVTHYKMDSDGGLTGVSVLKYAARDLLRAKSASEYESAVYTNNARPGGILETDTDLSGRSQVPDPNRPGEYLSKKENVRRAWERAHGGSANAFRVAVLDNGLSYKPIKIDAFDASFVAAREISIADIARFFGVPLHALMTGKQSFESNEQNSLEFVQGRGLAILQMMEEEDSYKLLLDSELKANLWIRRNLDGRLRGDTSTRREFYRTMREIGAYSVNDVLAREDLPDVPGGNTRQASLNFVPLEDWQSLSKIRNGGG